MAMNVTDEFERQRAHLRAVAYRMLGSVSEAEDAVQEAWLRLDLSDTSAVSNLGAWLTTVVGRVCLDMLRARRARREDYVGTWLPEPIVSIDTAVDPEQEALLADSVGLALLVVLETLSPVERLAFVLHDMFGVSFEEIAPIVPAVVRGAEEVARTVLSRGAPFAPHARPAIVNGGAGLAVRIGGRPVAVIGFSVAGGRILEIDLVANPEKLRGLAS